MQIQLTIFPLLCKQEKLLNAGVDINGLAPISFEDLLDNNNQFKNDFIKATAE